MCQIASRYWIDMGLGLCRQMTHKLNSVDFLWVESLFFPSLETKWISLKIMQYFLTAAAHTVPQWQ